MLRILLEEIHDLDPVFVDDVYEMTVTNQVFEGLVGFGEDMALRPVLAQSWTVSGDRRIYQFRLREGVRFHNGEIFDAEAVVSTFKRVLDPGKPSPSLAESYLDQILGADQYRAGLDSSLAGVRAIEPLLVEFELTQPLSLFLSVLAMDQLRIVPPEVGREWFGDDHPPVGTGPFRFGRRDWDGSGGSRLSLHRNTDYWGTTAYLDSVEFLAFPDLEEPQRVEFLVAGAVDIAGIESGSVALLTSAGLRIRTVPELAVSLLGVQSGIPPLDDVRIRQAIARCIDRKKLVLPGARGRILSNGVLPPGLPGSSSGVRILPYSPDEAARLVEEAGFGPQFPTPPIPLFLSSRGPSYRWVTETLIPDLAAIGISIQVEVVSWPELDRKMLGGDAPLFLLSWIADVPDPDGFLYPLFCTGEPNNLFGFSDLEVDEWLREARQLPRGVDRHDLYQRAESRILAEVAAIPLYHEVQLYACSPEVCGSSLGPQGLGNIAMNKVWLGRSGPAVDFVSKETSR